MQPASDEERSSVGAARVGNLLSECTLPFTYRALSTTPMKSQVLLFLVLPSITIFIGCETMDGASSAVTKPQPAAGAYGQPLTAVNGQGTVVIMEGSRKVSVCNTASPNIEQTRFINEQDQIVVKSRGNHGPATVQLFNTRTGAEQGRVFAYAIKGGQPAWAAGMGE
jgi:hypothetical protein